MTQAALKTWTDVKAQRRNAIPEGLWLRCPGCGQMVYRKQMEANLHVCPECSHHFRIGASERIKQLSDPASFEPIAAGLSPTDPLKFRDIKTYSERLLAEQIKTGRNDAVIAGTCFIKGRPAMLVVLDLEFMMGSMGSVVGETVTRAIEGATERNLPLVIVSGSGGARMQESGLSLMQMAKTSAALGRHDDAGGLFISVLTDPTTGGVTASFAMLGDVIVAEPKALIGFAGPRVIQQTIKQELPEGFQRSEYLLKAGMVDRVVHRADLRSELARLIDFAGMETVTMAEQPPVTRWPRVRAPVVGRVSWWRLLAAGFGHGVFMYLAFPPASVWPLVFLALGPLVWAACKGASTPVRTGLLTALGMLPFWLIEQAWLFNVTQAGYPALAVYLSLYTFVFVWALSTARSADWPIPMSIVVPIVWTGLEILRGSVVFTGYAFFLLGHPLIDNVVLAAPAAVLGAYAVSFLCASLAGAVADATGWSGLPRHAGGIAALAAVVLWGSLAVAGEWSGRAGATRDVRMAVVQTNVPQDNKNAWTIGQRLRDFRKFLDMTKQAASQRPEPDLIVWPETMFPGFALNSAAVQAERDAAIVFKVNDPDFPQGATVTASVFADELLKVQTDLGVPMLVGAITAEGLHFANRPDGGISRESERRFNSAAVVRMGQVEEVRYDKVDLMPFGEVIPYIWRWPSLQQRVLAFGAAGMSFDLSFGAHAAPLEVRLGRYADAPASADRLSTIRLATPICFEMTRSDLCRRLVRSDGTGGASAIVNLSNDGWFGASEAGRRVHLLSARWRSVELGLPSVRAVNTGISCAIDRRGRIINDRVTGPSAGPAGNDGRAEGVLMATIPVEPGGHATIFSRVGDWPMYGVGMLGALGVAAMWRRRRVQSRLGV